MYTSHIGKKFFERYKERFNLELDIVQFFDEVFYPLFFRDSRYLIWVANSPFAQKPIVKQLENGKWSVSSKDTLVEFEREPTIGEMRDVQLLELKRKFTSEKPDMSFIPAFFTSDDTIDTSGMVSNTGYSINLEEMYASWIGYCCAIKEDKSYALYVVNDSVFDHLWDGWQQYRNWLSQTQSFKGNDIQQWNSQWIFHKLTGGENKSFSPSIETDGIKGVTWTKLLFAFSYGLNTDNLMIYANRYIADKQKYVSLGFIELYLKSAKKIYDLYKTLFLNNAINPKQFADLYETEWGFSHVCQSGTIGLKQIEPKDLKKYFSGGEKLPSNKDYEKSQITFNIYITWIIAMLNNKEFLHLANNTASALHKYIIEDKNAENAKRTRSNEVEAVINAKSKKEFASTLIPLVQKAPELASDFNAALDAIHLDIPIDNVSYFITLLRFKYSLPEQLLYS